MTVNEKILSVYSTLLFVKAWKRFNSRMGNHFAAAITYLSFLSIIPILMLAFAIAGFVLSSKPELIARFIDTVVLFVLQVKETSLIALLARIVNIAVSQRTAVGVLGLLLAFYSGISWIGSVRVALSAQISDSCEFPKTFGNLFVIYARDFGSCLSLFIVIALSVSLTSFLINLQGNFFKLLPGDICGKLHFLIFFIALILAMIPDFFIFLWIFLVLPPKRLNFSSVLRGALMSALAMQIVKTVMVYVLPSLAKSPSGAMFGSVVGLLAFFNIFARITLYSAAWIAEADDVRNERKA